MLCLPPFCGEHISQGWCAHCLAPLGFPGGPQSARHEHTDFAAVLPAKSSVLYLEMMSSSNACYGALGMDFEIQERSGLYQSEETFLGYRLYIMLSFGRKYFIERTIIVPAVALAWICFMLGSSAASIVR